MKKLSVAIATHNEEQNLGRCLDSVVSWTYEIIVVDGASSDRTVEVAKTYTSKIIKTDNPPIFHINKQKAVSACTGEWILQLDADEVVPNELKNEIVETVRSEGTMAGYYLPRKNYFLGHWLRKGGQYPDYVIRLFQRGKGHFPSKSVHEQIAIDGKVGYLKNALLHYSHRTLDEYWRKADAYTSLTAKDLQKRNIPLTLFSWFEYSVLKPAVTFFSLFVRHKGFIDGYHGLLFALFSALHYPKAYNKYRQLLVQ